MLLYTTSKGLIEIRPGQEIELSEEITHPFLDPVTPPPEKRVTKKRRRKVDTNKEVTTDGEHSDT